MSIYKTSALKSVSDIDFLSFALVRKLIGPNSDLIFNKQLYSFALYPFSSTIWYFSDKTQLMM